MRNNHKFDIFFKRISKSLLNQSITATDFFRKTIRAATIDVALADLKLEFSQNGYDVQVIRVNRVY